MTDVEADLSELVLYVGLPEDIGNLNAVVAADFHINLTSMSARVTNIFITPNSPLS